MLNKNQAKVCENAGIVLKLEYSLRTLESEYKEVMELFELFDHFSEIKFHDYTCSFNKKSKELKRLLKNSEKRLNYNMKKC